MVGRGAKAQLIIITAGQGAGADQVGQLLQVGRRRYGREVDPRADLAVLQDVTQIGQQTIRDVDCRMGQAKEFASQGDAGYRFMEAGQTGRSGRSG